MARDELIDIAVGDIIDKNAREFPQNDAVVYPHEGKRWTWAQWKEECDEVARGFLAMGIKRGDHVAIWATNRPEWLMTMFATAKIGAVLVTVNTNYKRFELEYLLRQSDAKMLVMTSGTKDSDYYSHLREICPELKYALPGELSAKLLPCLTTVVSLNGHQDGMYEWTDVYRMAKSVPDAERESLQSSLSTGDVINMQYTSGTTGFPKGVMLTHYNIVNDGKAIGDCMAFTEKDRLCIPVPLFHCFGCVLGVMACITHATTMVMVDHFHPIRVMEAIEIERCTAVHGVPTMFIAMLDHERFSEFNFSTMRTGIMAGSPCPIEFMKRAVSEMNMREITISYGQTECSPVCTMTRTDDPVEIRVTTVGRALPHMEVKIIDTETGEDAPTDITGEIVTRGYHVMRGYYNMPEATAAAIDEKGWLHTGDLGSMDKSGYFKITGRLKDMIIRGGENIYPREIEEFLYTHPAVKDVQVIGVPDIKYGEEVLACVILREGAQATEQELIDYVKNGLSKFKCPRYVRFMEAFPMTASMKIQKFKMREWAVEELHLQAAAGVETA